MMGGGGGAGGAADTSAPTSTPGGGIGNPINTPDPLTRYKWWILGGLTLLLVAAAIYLLRGRSGPSEEVARAGFLFILFGHRRQALALGSAFHRPARRLHAASSAARA